MAVDSDLITYIRRETQNGVTAHELRETLMEAGWNELDVDNGLRDVAAGLRPVTEGASIHEDLAQVRGMVAHLASRVNTLEIRLTQIPVPAMLPAMPVPLQLPRGHQHRRLMQALMIVVLGFVVFGGSFVFRAWQASALEPQTAAALAILLIVVLVVAWRMLLRRSRR